MPQAEGNTTLVPEHVQVGGGRPGECRHKIKTRNNVTAHIAAGAWMHGDLQKGQEAAATEPCVLDLKRYPYG